MLGISTYLSDINEQYLKQAAEHGASMVFTSLQIPEEGICNVETRVMDMVKLCDQLGLKMVPDVSPQTLELLGTTRQNIDSLTHLGIDSIRLDYGFDAFDELKTLQNHFRLVLNASVVTNEYVAQAQREGLDCTKITLLHNFYPHGDTGLGKEAFVRKNKELKSFGFRVQAFVPGDAKRRFPLFEALPTLEQHRNINPLVAAVDLCENCFVDDVFIGDSQALPTTLEEIAAYCTNKTISLHAHLRSGHKGLYNQPLHCRKDVSDSLVRLITPRTPDIPQELAEERLRGSITQDNELAKRYSGEMSIVKKTLPGSARTNVIGFVDPRYLRLVDYIRGYHTILIKELS